MIQFYAPHLSSDPILSPEESHHCVKVLRKREGDTIFVTDGRGARYECRIVSSDTRGVRLDVISKEIIAKSWGFKIVLAVAPTKNADRMAWLVEKATEIGVDEIRFVICRNSERRSINLERLKRNAVSAMNQSLKTRIPLLTEDTSLKDIISFEGEKFFGYCDSQTSRLPFAKECHPGHNIIVAIGPEGDFTKEEVELLRGNGFKAVTFGEERLRTETAALYAVTAIHVINNIAKQQI